MRTGWMVGLLVATALAGCSDPGAPSQGDDVDGLEDLDLSATSTTGVIRGVVLDQNIMPIAGAKVALKQASIEATSNDNGVFGFQNLAPGIYFLEVGKPGFQTVQQSVDVEAGVASPPIVKVQLVAMPGTEPFSLYRHFQGHIGCAFKAANYVFPNQCAAIGDADQFEILDFGTTNVPLLLQTEIVWSSTQEFGKALGTIQYVREADGGQQRVGNVWGPSPLVCTVTRDAVCDNGDGTGGGGEGLNETGFPGYYFASVYAACYMQCVPGTAVGVGIIVDQSYDLYSSGFFNYLPPEGWTLQADGEYPPPI